MLLANAFDGNGRGAPKHIEEMGAVNVIAQVPWRPQEYIDTFGGRAQPILAEMANGVRSKRLVLGEPMLASEGRACAWRVERYRGIPLFGWLDDPEADVINFGLYTLPGERMLTGYRAGGIARLFRDEKRRLRPTVTVIEPNQFVQ